MSFFITLATFLSFVTLGQGRLLVNDTSIMFEGSGGFVSKGSNVVQVSPGSALLSEDGTDIQSDLGNLRGSLDSLGDSMNAVDAILDVLTTPVYYPKLPYTDDFTALWYVHRQQQNKFKAIAYAQQYTDIPYRHVHQHSKVDDNNRRPRLHDGGVLIPADGVYWINVVASIGKEIGEQSRVTLMVNDERVAWELQKYNSGSQSLRPHVMTHLGHLYKDDVVRVEISTSFLADSLLSYENQYAQFQIIELSTLGNPYTTLDNGNTLLEGCDVRLRDADFVQASGSASEVVPYDTVVYSNPPEAWVGGEYVTQSDGIFIVQVTNDCCSYIGEDDELDAIIQIDDVMMNRHRIDGQYHARYACSTVTLTAIYNLLAGQRIVGKSWVNDGNTVNSISSGYYTGMKVQKLPGADTSNSIGYKLLNDYELASAGSWYVLEFDSKEYGPSKYSSGVYTETEAGLYMASLNLGVENLSQNSVTSCSVYLNNSRMLNKRNQRMALGNRPDMTCNTQVILNLQVGDTVQWKIYVDTNTGALPVVTVNESHMSLTYLGSYNGDLLE